jgi:NADP-dependent 3-hydroxy acid dehydrogenase YdfG
VTSNKAIVVGASGGIGAAVARALADQGTDTVLMGRDGEKLARVVADCADAGATAIPLVCDIARLDSLETIVGEALEQLGGLNFLINCAGVSAQGKMHEIDLSSADSIINTNLRAHYYLARYALPEINKQPGGAVVKIGSVNHAYSGVNTYQAANLGIDGYAEALFEDVREFGTRVCTIKPGYVNTALVSSDNLNPELMIQPEDIAKTVLFVLSMPTTACPTEITILPQRSPYR